jgi:hypothetical protein
MGPGTDRTIFPSVATIVDDDLMMPKLITILSGSISSSHDEVFRNNIPPGFFGPFNGRSFPTNNFGGPFVIPPFEGGFFPPTEGLPIYGKIFKAI